MFSTTGVTGWAGNLAVQKIVQKENGDLALAPVDSVAEGSTARRALAVKKPEVLVKAEIPTPIRTSLPAMRAF